MRNTLFSFIAQALLVAYVSAKDFSACVCNGRGPSFQKINSDNTYTYIASAVIPANNQASCIAACAATAGCNLAFPLPDQPTVCYMEQFPVTNLGGLVEWDEASESHWFVLGGTCASFGVSGYCADTNAAGAYGSVSYTTLSSSTSSTSSTTTTGTSTSTTTYLRMRKSAVPSKHTPT
ncbi:hypothetical protein EMMF5_004731 [Cystobasidiomycetes sp. EMM_F5]